MIPSLSSYSEESIPDFLKHLEKVIKVKRINADANTTINGKLFEDLISTLLVSSNETADVACTFP